VGSISAFLVVERMLEDDGRGRATLWGKWAAWGSIIDVWAGDAVVGTPIFDDGHRVETFRCTENP
jgi:hypothetical protein